MSMLPKAGVYTLASLPALTESLRVPIILLLLFGILYSAGLLHEQQALLSLVFQLSILISLSTALLLQIQAFRLLKRRAIPLNGQAVLVPPESDLGKTVADVAAKVGAYPSATILIDKEDIAAMVVERKALCLSAGAIKLLQGSLLQWLIAHELAHILRNDVGANQWRLAGQVSATVIDSYLQGGRRKNPSSMWLVISYPYHLARVISKAITTPFQWGLDRLNDALRRQSEFAADRIAAEAISAKDGVIALGALSVLSGVTGRSATHPTIQERIRRLTRMHEST